MAKATQTVTTHKKTTVKIKAKAVPKGNVRCNVCGGKGYHKSPSKKK